ncbi:MAG: CPBP family intramembrane metalloprotease [Puniceicoccales bacterium]|jgi:membrane protease YdiL (CAAX protease family)|nr:CPBP family intramembrane metalloprotease [Puniceicoccales bacterium]
MNVQRLSLLIFGLQMFVGCCLFFGNPRRKDGGGVSFSPEWKVPPRVFAAFLAIGIFIAHVFPLLCLPLLEALRIPRAPYGAAFLGQLVLLSFLLRTVHSNHFSFSDGLSAYLPWGHVFRSGIRNYLKSVPLLFLVTVLWMVPLFFLETFGIPLPLGAQDLLLELETATPVFFLTIVAMAVGVAPVVEELFFRGGIYRYLKSTVGKTPATFLTGLVFALLHWNLCSFLPLFVLSMILVGLYEREGNLLPCVLVHGLFNLSNLILCQLQSMAS